MAGVRCQERLSLGMITNPGSPTPAVAIQRLLSVYRDGGCGEGWITPSAPLSDAALMQAFDGGVRSAVAYRAAGVRSDIEWTCSSTANSHGSGET